MHTILSGVLICLAAVGLALSPEITGAALAQAGDAPPPLRVMSFNLRYNNPDDGLNAWPHRKETVAGMIRFHEADVVGVQEAQIAMLHDLDSLLTGYDWFGLPRASGDAHDEYSAILYRPERLELLDHDTFWLSETPDVRSKGWDAALPRIVTWGKFRDKATGKVFFHFNTHFDHRGEQA
ncbi:MAG TPA: endonuclease/exonuclease/phosphatase family protein, partial [Rhodothermales bacterium]|nr:endonuclease/exonuclease/phosphatase family protein [Rhodothermales bacterium]